MPESKMVVSFSNMLKDKNLLHLGCKDCGAEEAYLGVKVLNKLGIDVEVKEFECGCDYFGVDSEKIKALAEENKNKIKKYSQVIVGCARCYHVMKRNYDYIKVRHISEVISSRLKNFKGNYRGSGEIFYHDPCFLSRYEKVMDEPRRVLVELGYTIREFKNNRERTDCCGDYSQVRVLRSSAAEMRMSQLPGKCQLTSTCTKCTQNFAAFNKPNNKITVNHFLDLVDFALNIEIPAVY